MGLEAERHPDWTPEQLHDYASRVEKGFYRQYDKRSARMNRGKVQFHHVGGSVIEKSKSLNNLNGFY
jgi:hypothetical protein